MRFLLVAALLIIIVSADVNKTNVVLPGGSPRLVFCHYMLWVPGIADNQDGFAKEMELAKSYGIDGFAVNTAQWNSVTWAIPRMTLFAKAAEQTGFKFFMSADMTVEFIGSPNGIVDMISSLAKSSAYYKVDGQAFLSTFVGQGVGWDWQNSVLNPLAQRGVPIYFVPFFDGDPQSIVNRFSFAKGFFHWTAWPYNNGNLQVVDPSFDRTYRSVTSSSGKVFMAPVSPYFAKHYCGLPPDAKPNWVFGNYKGPGLWIDHWKQLIDISPDFIEIVTWNDYPEASYIGPVTAPWGISDKCNGNGPTMYDRASFPHDAYGDLARYFITTYKTGSAQITQDKVYVFYRGFSKNIQCPDPTGLGPVQNQQSNDDQIYFVGLLKAPATIVVRSGNSQRSFDVGAGLSTSSMDFAVGAQSVSVARNGGQIGSKTFSKQISTSCTDGNLYDMNVFSDFFSF